jgi:hypothetical protein
MGKNGYDQRSELLWVTPEMLNLDPFQKYRSLLHGFDWENWRDHEVKQKNVELMRRKSSLHLEIGDRKGGWIFPEKIYVDDPTYVTRASEHVESIDRLILAQPMCHSLAVRLDYISNTLLPYHIEQSLAKQDNVRIASFGSGTGRDVMNAMCKFNGRITADFYDLDPLAFREGKKIATEKGLLDKVNFLQQDLTKVDQMYDIGLLVGVICPLPDPIAKRVLRSVRKNIIPERGRLIVSSSSDKMEISDPLSRWLIEYSANWFLQFRTAERMKEVLESGDLQVLNNTQEPSGYNKLAVCSRVV